MPELRGYPSRLLSDSEAILGRQTESVIHAGLRHRGWPTVRTVLPAVLKELHYHTDADGFVLIVDSNGSPPHLRHVSSLAAGRN
jgi:hypothetical protein